MWGANNNFIVMDLKLYLTLQVALLDKRLWYPDALGIADLDYCRFHNYIVITLVSIVNFVTLENSGVLE